MKLSASALGHLSQLTFDDVVRECGYLSAISVKRHGGTSTVHEANAFSSVELILDWAEQRNLDLADLRAVMEVYDAERNGL